MAARAGARSPQRAKRPRPRRTRLQHPPKQRRHPAIKGPHVHVPFQRIGEHIEFIRQARPDIELFFTGTVLDQTDNSEIKSVMDSLGYTPAVSIHGPFMDLSPGGVDPAVRAVTMQRFMRTLEVAEIVRPEAVVFHSGYEKWKYAHHVEIWMEGSLATWRPLIQRAGDIGTRLAIENIFEDEPGNLRLLMAELGSETFGICFDTGHFNLFSELPLKDWMDSIGKHIIELHVHDNLGDRDSHLPPGEGSFDFKAFFAMLGDRDVLLTIENHDPSAVMKSIESLKAMVPSLRGPARG